MLITFFLNLAYWITSSFLSLFPTADTSVLSAVGGAVASASSYLSAINSFTPVSTIITIAGVFISIEVFILFIKIVNWIIRKIPTIN
jgi:hypothetical protein